MALKTVGVRIVAVFDNDAAKVGTRLSETMVVEPTSAISASVRKHKCQIAIIATPADAAQDVAETLINAGIKSILCYAPITLTVPKHVRVEYIDPVIQLQHMTFYLQKGCLDDST